MIGGLLGGGGKGGILGGLLGGEGGPLGIFKKLMELPKQLMKGLGLPDPMEMLGGGGGGGGPLGLLQGLTGSAKERGL